MASIEYITKRIEGKEKEIDKLQKKLARIEKAEATGWEVNPYCYDESDKRWALRDLEEARKNLEKYKADLASETEKAASRNVQVIIDFLDNWRARRDRHGAVQLRKSPRTYAREGLHPGQPRCRDQDQHHTALCQT